jgi:hypothetical protein
MIPSAHLGTFAMETPLLSLWLPIVASGVALFFASWMAWMLLPHHKKEWTGMANEDAVIAQLRSAGVAPGQYVFPYAACSADMGSAEHKAKIQAGPNGSLIVWGGAPNMGVNMLCTVIFFLVVSTVIAYLAAMVIPPTNDHWFIFRFVGTAGVLTYGAANILNGIWFGRKMVGDILDGVAYGLITGAIFTALWPAASAVAV